MPNSRESADELMTSMAGILDWIRGKKRDPWKLFLEQLREAGGDCGKLARLYAHWIERGTLAAKAGAARSSQGMMMIRRKQRQHNCPI